MQSSVLLILTNYAFHGISYNNTVGRNIFCYDSVSSNNSSFSDSNS